MIDSDLQTEFWIKINPEGKTLAEVYQISGTRLKQLMNILQDNADAFKNTKATTTDLLRSVLKIDGLTDNEKMAMYIFTFQYLLNQK